MSNETARNGAESAGPLQIAGNSLRDALRRVTGLREPTTRTVEDPPLDLPQPEAAGPAPGAPPAARLHPEPQVPHQVAPSVPPQARTHAPPPQPQPQAQAQTQSVQTRHAAPGDGHTMRNSQGETRLNPSRSQPPVAAQPHPGPRQSEPVSGPFDPSRPLSHLQPVNSEAIQPLPAQPVTMAPPVPGEPIAIPPAHETPPNTARPSTPVTGNSKAPIADTPTLGQNPSDRQGEALPVGGSPHAGDPGTTADASGGPAGGPVGASAGTPVGTLGAGTAGGATMTAANAAGTPDKTQLVRGMQNPDRTEYHQEPVVGWLVVIGGPGLGAFRPLYEGNNSIGRSSSQRVAINFGDDSISAEEQAYIRYDSRDREFLFIPNLTKTNVVSINEHKPTTAVKLSSMDVITMGQSQLVFVPFCGADFDWSELAEIQPAT